MPRNWTVIGAGRQGPAVAYDLARYGDAKSITLADFDLDLAEKSAAWINGLLGNEAIRVAQVDVSDSDALESYLSNFDLAVAAAPYRLNPLISKAGLAVKCSVVDMGVDTPDALQIHALNDKAVANGVTMVTDCGVAPGLVNILAFKLLEEMPDAESIQLYCGGLPEAALPPFFHKVGFSVDSLLGEYVDDVESLKNGEVVHEEALLDLENLDFPGFGRLEAITTSGGTGTAPYAVKGRLKNYEYKTLRYPGHWSAMMFMRDAGFWSEVPLSDGSIPRAVSLHLMEQAMVEPNYRDVVVARVVASGPSGKKGFDLVDRYDPVTGFTSMQRTTGFSTSIVALDVAGGRIEPGCRACESAISPTRFIQEAAKRGITVSQAHLLTT